MGELEVRFTELPGPEPPGWSAFWRSRGATAVWDWTLMLTGLSRRSVPAFALTVHDGSDLVGIGAARLPGVRVRGRVVQGVLDVDCLVSASVPGLRVDGGAARYQAVLAGLRSAVRERFGARVNAVLLRQVPTTLLSAALRWPAVVREAPPIAWFRNDFADLDEYLASLSKSRRKYLRRVLRAFDRDTECTCQFTAAGDARPRLDARAVTDLNNAVVHRNHRRWWMPKRLMSDDRMAAILDHPDAELITYHAGQRLVAVGSLLGPGQLPTAYSWGALPLAEGGRRDLWFHHEATYVRHVIDAGLDGILSGAGTLEPKRSLGFRIEPNWSVLQPLRGPVTPRYLDLTSVAR